jgi:hypothetical protein
MRRLCANGSEQLLFTVDPYLAAGQNAGIHAAHIAHADAAVILDLYRHQADLIHMGGQHHLGSQALFMGDDVKHAVDSYLIAIRLELLFYIFRHRLLVAGKAGQRRYLGKEGFYFHGIPPLIIAPAGRGWS